MQHRMEEETFRDSLLKYFVHGILFSLLLLGLEIVWAFILAFLAVIGFLIGLIIGLILFFILIGGLNTFLMVHVWDTSMKTDWKSLLVHGFALFIALIVAGIPRFVINFFMPSLIAAIVMFIIYCFIDGFVAKEVGNNWEESEEEEKTEETV